MDITNINQSSQQSSAESIARFRLWQLLSPSLPIGSYAYSQGLEYAVESGWVSNEKEMFQWLSGLISHQHQQLDIPVLARLYAAWSENNIEQIKRWNHYLLATRESSELTEEDRQLGRALNVLLKDLGLDQTLMNEMEELSFATALSYAGTQWDIPLKMLAQAYVWMWLENQVAAAIKLIPIGQTAGQRILRDVAEMLADVIDQALEVSEDDIGQSAMALGIASSRHETQYTRIFRS